MLALVAFSEAEPSSIFSFNSISKSSILDCGGAVYAVLNTNKVNGNLFEIEEVKITAANEVILNELFRCRRSSGIDGGWVRQSQLRNLVSSNGALMGTMTGLIKLGIAEKQSQTLLDGEVMKFYRIRREHVYGR